MRRRRGGAREPESAASLVEAVVARLGGASRALEQRAFEAYRDAVGTLLDARTEPDRLHGGTLFVTVKSAPYAHQLTLLRRDILDRMAAILGAGLVTDLRTRVGTVSAPAEPPRPAPHADRAPGPRPPAPDRGRPSRPPR